MLHCLKHNIITLVYTLRQITNIDSRDCNVYTDGNVKTQLLVALSNSIQKMTHNVPNMVQRPMR